MDLKLVGKTALVTGASMGIGRAIAKGLAAEGVQVAGVARRHDILRNQQRARSLPLLDLAPELLEKMDAAGNPCDSNALGG